MRCAAHRIWYVRRRRTFVQTAASNTHSQTNTHTPTQLNKVIHHLRSRWVASIANDSDGGGGGGGTSTTPLRFFLTYAHILSWLTHALRMYSHVLELEANTNAHILHYILAGWLRDSFRQSYNNMNT